MGVVLVQRQGLWFVSGVDGVDVARGWGSGDGVMLVVQYQVALLYLHT